MTRLDAVAAALRRDPGDLDAWAELGAELTRLGHQPEDLVELVATPEGRAAAAAGLARTPAARGLADLLLSSQGMMAGGGEVDEATGMPGVAIGAPPLRCRYRWVPGPAGGAYLGERPVRVTEYRKHRPPGCPDPAQWERQQAAPNRPVLFVTWEHAVLYAAAQGARLPRVAERLRATCGGPPAPRPALPLYPADLTPMENPPEAPREWHAAVRDAASGPAGPYGHRGLRANVLDWCLDEAELPGAPGGLGRAVVGVDWTRSLEIVHDQDLTEAFDQREGSSLVGLRLAVDVLGA